MLFRPISISLMVFRCESTFTDFENSLRLSIQVKYTHSSTVVILSFLFPCPPISPFNVYFRLNHNANYYFWNRTYRIPKCIASVLTFKQKTDKEREQKKKQFSKYIFRIWWQHISYINAFSCMCVVFGFVRVFFLLLSFYFCWKNIEIFYGYLFRRIAY